MTGGEARIGLKSVSEARIQISQPPLEERIPSEWGFRLMSVYLYNTNLV